MTQNFSSTAQKAIRAWKNVMLFSASLHIVILLILAIRDQSLEHLNYLSILNLNLLLPNLFDNTTRLFLAGILLAAVYGFFLVKEFGGRSRSTSDTKT